MYSIFKIIKGGIFLVNQNKRTFAVVFGRLKLSCGLLADQISFTPEATDDGQRTAANGELLTCQLPSVMPP